MTVLTHFQDLPLSENKHITSLQSGKEPFFLQPCRKEQERERESGITACGKGKKKEKEEKYG